MLFLRNSHKAKKKKEEEEELKKLMQRPTKS